MACGLAILQIETGTALHEAALHGKFEVVKLLLERGINIHGKDQKGRTVLELLSDHQSQQKSFNEIYNSINGKYWCFTLL